jgi:hypothetical protein
MSQVCCGVDPEEPTKLQNYFNHLIPAPAVAVNDITTQKQQDTAKLDPDPKSGEPFEPGLLRRQPTAALTQKSPQNCKTIFNFSITGSGCGR